MPDLTPRDDLGRPIDYERQQRIVDREYAEAEADPFLLERCEPPASNLVAFAVRDRSGRIHGMLALEWDAMDMDLPNRLLKRVQQAAAARARPDLKLVV